MAGAIRTPLSSLTTAIGTRNALIRSSPLPKTRTVRPLNRQRSRRVFQGASDGLVPYTS